MHDLCNIISLCLMVKHPWYDIGITRIGSAGRFHYKLYQQQVKGLSQEDLAGRSDLVLALPERIQAIPDGNSVAANKSGGRGSSSDMNINFETGVVQLVIIEREIS